MIEDILKEFNLSEEQAQKLLNQYKEDKKDWEREVGIYKQRVDNMKLEREKALKALKSESAQAVENLKLENNKLTKTYALKESLRELGVTKGDYADYIIFKQGGFDKFTFDENGKPMGLDKIISSYKKSMPAIFLQSDSEYKPQSGEVNTGTNPWSKNNFNLTEQGRILRENPVKARELMFAAGFKEGEF